jgi:membrane protein
MGLLPMFKQFSRLAIRQSKLVIRLWNRHGCVDLSAAFAFHSLQSIFPFLLLCLGIAARLFGQADGALKQIIDFTEQVLPDGSSALIADILETLIRQGRAAGVVGAVALLITASNATLSLIRRKLVILGNGTLEICCCNGQRQYLALYCFLFCY